jgi:hypothetical protein
LSVGGTIGEIVGVSTGTFVGGRIGEGTAMGEANGTIGVELNAFSQPQRIRNSSLSKRWHDSSGIRRSTSADNRIVSHVASDTPCELFGRGTMTSGFVIVETPPSEQT